MRVGLCDGDQCDAPGLFVMLAPQAQEIRTLGQFGHKRLTRTCGVGLRRVYNPIIDSALIHH